MENWLTGLLYNRRRLIPFRGTPRTAYDRVAWVSARPGLHSLPQPTASK
jgi:hypothetical protein